MKTTDRLAKTVAQGKTRYILVHGVLVWGLLTASLVTAWSFYTSRNMTASDVATFFIAFPIGGIFYGAFTWTLLKRKYARMQYDAAR